MAKYEVSIDGKTHEVEIVRDDGVNAVLKVDGQEYQLDARNVTSGPSPVVGSAAPLSAPARAAAPKPPAAGGGLIAAPLAGLVLQVMVAVGDTVNAGDAVVRLEAMKMENDIQADAGGKVAEILVSQGDEVQEGQPLVQLEG